MDDSNRIKKYLEKPPDKVLEGTKTTSADVSKVKEYGLKILEETLDKKWSNEWITERITKIPESDLIKVMLAFSLGKFLQHKQEAGEIKGCE